MNRHFDGCECMSCASRAGEETTNATFEVDSVEKARNL